MGSAHAGAPKAQAEPEPPTPEEVEEHDQAGEEPERDELLTARILGSSGHESDDAGEGERSPCGQDDARAAEAGRTEGEREGEAQGGDGVPGHTASIGVYSRLGEGCAEGVFPGAEGFVELGVRDHERSEHANAVRVDP
jgi:hypothetical protein